MLKFNPSTKVRQNPFAIFFLKNLQLKYNQLTKNVSPFVALLWQKLIMKVVWNEIVVMICSIREQKPCSADKIFQFQRHSSGKVYLYLAPALSNYDDDDDDDHERINFSVALSPKSK